MSTGAITNISFRFLKLASQASFHINGTPFLVNCVKGEAILAKSCTNLRKYPASPKKLHTDVTVVERSHSMSASTLVGSMDTLSFDTTCPRKETCDNENFHFENLAYNLFSDEQELTLIKLGSTPTKASQISCLTVG